MVFVVVLHGYKQQVFLLSVNHTLFINQGWLMPQSQKRTDGSLQFRRGAVEFTNQIISVMTDAIDKMQHKLVSKIIQAKYRFYTFHSGNRTIIQINERQLQKN